MKSLLQAFLGDFGSTYIPTAALKLRLSPHFYSQHKDMESRRKGMEDYLKEHGLNINSKQNEVRAVKIKLELQRDLEGMDTSNIMDGNGRRPMRASARKSYKYGSDLLHCLAAQGILACNSATSSILNTFIQSLSSAHSHLVGNL